MFLKLHVDKVVLYYNLNIFEEAKKIRKKLFFTLSLIIKNLSESIFNFEILSKTLIVKFEILSLYPATTTWNPSEPAVTLKCNPAIDASYEYSFNESTIKSQ